LLSLVFYASVVFVIVGLLLSLSPFGLSLLWSLLLLLLLLLFWLLYNTNFVYSLFKIAAVVFVVVAIVVVVAEVKAVVDEKSTAEVVS